MSPNDNRKWYNASLGYDAFKVRQAARMSSIVPKLPIISVSQPNPSVNFHQSTITGGTLLMSPLASPAGDDRDPLTHLKDGFQKHLIGRSLNEAPVNLTARKIPPFFLNGTRQRAISSPQADLERMINGPNQRGKATFVDAGSAVLPEANGVLPENSPTTPAVTTSKRPASADLPREDVTKPTPSSPNTNSKSRKRASTNITRSSSQEDDEHITKLNHILSVHGFILGTIKRHSDVMREGIVPGDWLKILGWDGTSVENRVPEIIWRMLVADRTPEGGKPPGWYQRACLHGLRDRRISNSKGDLHSARAEKTSEMTSKYLRRVQNVVWKRRIFEMESKVCESDSLFGLAPENTEARDIICILFGCSVPVVLRKVDAKEGVQQELYELVGEAYVHGKMDGEAVRDQELLEKVKRRFLLQ